MPRIESKITEVDINIINKRRGDKVSGRVIVGFVCPTCKHDTYPIIDLQKNQEVYDYQCHHCEKSYEIRIKTELTASVSLTKKIK